jgi:hypothetical protein
VDPSLLPTGRHQYSAAYYGDDNFLPATSASVAQRIRKNALPVGVVRFSNGIVKGFAYDPNAPATAVDVQVIIDGQVYTTITASEARAGLMGQLGQNHKHGFSLPIPQLADGNHTVSFQVKDHAVTAYVPVGQVFSWKQISWAEKLQEDDPFLVLTSQHLLAQ